MLIDFLGIMVLPAVAFSFYRVTKRDEFKDLRESGFKLNLNMHNLWAAYKRPPDDPLKESHIKLARIGFWHWFFIPVGFVALLSLGVIFNIILEGK